MSCIVYQTDKRTGIKYAYESVSYWDKEKKQPRSKRKYIGRVDPETNEIIKGRRKKGDGASSVSVDTSSYTKNIEKLRSQMDEKTREIADLKAELSSCQALLKEYKKAVTKANSILTECMDKF